jgi:hypothetical protein
MPKRKRKILVKRLKPLKVHPIIHKLMFSELTVAVIGLIVILILSFTAISKGLDGVMFGSSMAGIGAIIGWVFKNFRPGKAK